MLFSLPVLMYHSISSHGDRLSVRPDTFIRHCEILAQNGWRGIPFQEAEEYFLKGKRLPKKSCLITFDDGYLDNYVHAEPILREFGHYGVLFPVATLLEKRGDLRPTREILPDHPEYAADIALLDQRPLAIRSGRYTPGITFCSWTEALHMHNHGNIAMAPHTLRHDRVVADLQFPSLHSPDTCWTTFFDVPPYTMPWGFPNFTIKQAMNHRGYLISPRVFDLVERMVPQETEEARLFLRNPANQARVTTAIAKLPCLGVLESESMYRKRIAHDLRCCMDIFTEKLGYSPTSFSWPWGRYNTMALEEGRKAGFKLFFTTRRGLNLSWNGQAIRRMAVRECSGEILLGKITGCTNPFKEIPNNIVVDWRRSATGRFLRVQYQRNHSLLHRHFAKKM